jgi:hypothetical protein
MQCGSWHVRAQHLWSKTPAGCRLEEALLQNSLADVLAADLDLLGDDEAEGLGSTAAACGAGGSSSSSAGGKHGPAQAERGGLTEAQSFTDLAYSKNKVCGGEGGAVCVCVCAPTPQAAGFRLKPNH